MDLGLLMNLLLESGIILINSVDNKTTVICCEECVYLRECRVVLKCSHPCGLKNPSVDSYCSYGKQKEVIYEDKTD
jgi:hypothetical protein